MTYLFAYNFSANNIEGPTSGQGSVKITAEGTNKITESTIYGENGAINIVEDMLRKDHNMTNIVVSPMGWFKFDEEIEDVPSDAEVYPSYYERLYKNNEDTESEEDDNQKLADEEKNVVTNKE